MASIYKRKNENGSSVWRAVVRIKGYPSVCNHFERKQEAEDWSQAIERQIKAGQFKFDQHNHINTFSSLCERYLQDGVLEHHRSKKDTLRHIAYWQSRLNSFSLVHLTPELIGKERQLLIETPTKQGKQRSSATVNRYIATLSALFTYAVRQLRWINESPCAYLLKLKENPGRDRVLTEEEIGRLLTACKKSKSSYLYCIVLIALTTGARQGEILDLEWRHVDLDNKLAYLKETKNGRPRSIALADAVIEELKKLYRQRYVHSSLVFASKTTCRRIDIKKAWKRALKVADIDCRAHDMRHTFATMAAQEGASNLVLSTAMGHRTLEMLQRYTHLDVQVTKKLSTNIAEKIVKGTNQ